MAEQIQEVFWLTSAERQQLLYVSQAFEAIWGRPVESLYAYPGGHVNLILDSIHPSDRDQVVAAFANNFQSEYKQEYRIVRPNGSIRWVRSRFFPVQNSFGETWGIAGLSEDITERKQAEDILHQREQEFRALVELSPDIISRFDRELRHIYVNPPIKLVTGMLPQEFLGKTNRELGMPQAVLSSWEQSLQKVFQTGETDENEFSFLTPTGLKFYQSRLVPELAADGSVEFVLVICRDLTKNKQTEEALRESEERFRTVFESAPMGMVLANPKGMFLQTNQAFQEIFGYSETELQNLSFIDLTHPADRAENVKVFQELFLGKRTHFSLEKRCFRKDGSLVWVNVSVAAVGDANGLPQYAIGIIQDISDRKQAELALQQAHDELEKRVAERTAELAKANTLLQQEIAERKQAQKALKGQKEFLQTVIDGHPNAIVVKDTQGKYVLTNQAFIDFFGITVEECSSKTVADFHFNQAEVEQYQREDQEVLSLLQEQIISEKAVTTPTGEVRYFQAIKKYLLSPDGQTPLVLGVGTDITQRKQVEEALRESEQRYRLLIERMNDGVIVGNENDLISYVNDKFSEMLGYSPSEIIGHNLLEFLDEANQKILQEQRLRRRRGENGSYELGLRRKDGRMLLTLVSSSSILGTEGGFKGSFGVITDITALKAVESELQQAKEQLRAVLDAVPGCVSWISSEGRYLGVNQHLAQSFNLSPDALVGKELGFLKNSPEFVQFMTQFLESSAQTDRKVIETQANGSTRNYLIVAQKYNQGASAVSVGIDITESIQAQKALKTQKEFLQTVLDTNPNLIWVKDRADRVVLANRACADFFETTVEDMLGLTNYELPSNPADVEVCIAQDKEVLATLQEKFIPEETFPTPRGEVRWFQTIKKPIFSSDGQVGQILGVSTDITERKLAQEALKEQKEFLRTILDTNPNTIFVKDTEGKFVLVNQAYADIHGMSVEDLVGLTDDGLHPNQADTDRFIAQDVEVITTLRQKLIPEQAYHTQTGEVRWFQTIKKPIVSGNGQVCQVLGVSTDITERKLAQEALKAQKEFLQTVLDANPNMIFVKDKEGKIVLANQRYADFRGMSVEDLLGLTDAECNRNQAEVDQFLHEDQEVNTTLQEIFIPEEACRFPTGEVRWFQIIKKPIFSSDGQVGQVLGVCTDITERKLAEQQRRESEDQLCLALEAARIGFWDWNLQTGKITWSNNFKQLFGWSSTPEEGTYKSFIEIVHPEDRDRLHSCTQCCIATGEDCDIEFRIIWPDGSIHWIESKGQVFYDATGTPVRTTGINLDITARKQAEELQRQTQARLRRLVEANLIGVIFADFSGNITEANDTFLNMVGYTREDLRAGKVRWLDMTPPEYAEDDAQARAQIRLTGVCTPHEKEYIRKDGSRVPILTGSALLEGSEQDCVSFVVDLTWHKHAETQIQASLREKEVLLQEIHHRVKNNLQVICSLLDLQSQDIEEPATLEMFRESQNRVKSMALVHEKLYQSKDFASINFAEYIENLISYLFQVYRMNASNITLELDIDEVSLNIDQAIPCGLIISELVSNALKYAFPNSQEGTITIDFNSNLNNQITLIIKDNGVGFNTNFDFTNLNSLGLKLVNVLIHQLEGTLEVNYSAGTEFKIIFLGHIC